MGAHTADAAGNGVGRIVNDAAICSLAIFSASMAARSALVTRGLRTVPVPLPRPPREPRVDSPVPAPPRPLPRPRPRRIVPSALEKH
jgi:hypothetical protein